MAASHARRHAAPTPWRRPHPDTQVTICGCSTSACRRAAGLVLTFRPLAPVPDAVAPSPVTFRGSLRSAGRALRWVSKPTYRPRWETWLLASWPQAVGRSSLYGVGSPTGPSWDMSCQVDVNAASNRSGADHPDRRIRLRSAAQQYLQEHWVRSPGRAGPPRRWTESAMLPFTMWPRQAMASGNCRARQGAVHHYAGDGAPLKTDVSSQLVALTGRPTCREQT